MGNGDPVPSRPRGPLRGAWALVLIASVVTFACAIRVPRSVGVSFPGPAGKLEGSLFLPESRGPHAAIVLVHSARGNSRLDYLQEARFFAEHGVAALAYDKRGTGGSDGDLKEADFEFLAQDAVAAARYLRARAEVDSARVGYWGIGQGGWIAPLAAASDTAAAFVVLVSAPIVSPLEQTMYERTEELAAKGLDEGSAAALARLRRRVWEYWLKPEGSGTAASDSLHGAFNKAKRQPWFARAVVSHDLPESLVVDEAMGSNEHPARQWLVDDMPTFWSLRHDPIAVLKRVRAPILAIFGDKDRVVPVEESVANFRAALGAAYNRRGTTRLFRGADHAMMSRRGAGPFAKIEHAPGYRDSMMAWLGRVAYAGSGVEPKRP
jgi:pimeloyl-ACP methyl ester carboxylesterase